MLSRRELLVAAAGGALASLPNLAWATTARPVSLPELVELSDHALVGTPTSFVSRWETVGRSRRIVTYASVEVQQTIDGRPPKERFLTIRTLGGRVGDIGQLVHGEARLVAEDTSVFFLRPGSEGVFHVAAMAQGHYPLRLGADRERRLAASPGFPALLGEGTSAARQLVEKTVVEAEQMVCDCLLRGR